MFNSLDIASSFSILILPLEENMSSIDTREVSVESFVIVRASYSSSIFSKYRSSISAGTSEKPMSVV